MKRLHLIIIACCLSVILLASGITLAKYVADLGSGSGSLTSGYFYFRSNILTTDATPPTIVANGDETTFVIANGADSDTYSPMNINYTVTYSVMIDGQDDWTVVNSANYSLAGGKFSNEIITVTPMEQDGVVYDTVLVTATSTDAPYITTIRAIFSFDYTTEPTLVYEYEPNFGVITVTVNTNAGSGDYLIEWAGGVLPDNADPNGILSEGQAGPDSVMATLEKYGAYRLVFFVNPSDREYVDSMLESEADSIYSSLQDQGYTGSELDEKLEEAMTQLLDQLLRENIKITKQ